MVNTAELRAGELHTQEFIREKCQEIESMVKGGCAINALSGGVDSSVVTILGHKAIGERLKTYFINNGLMRKDEPQSIVSIFQKLGVKVEIVDAQTEFFKALKGITDPEEKREAITQTFYKDVFAKLVKKAGQNIFYGGQSLPISTKRSQASNGSITCLRSWALTPRRPLATKSSSLWFNCARMA